MAGDGYDLEGRLITRTELPPRFRGLAGCADLILGFDRDELGVVVLREHDVTYALDPGD